jgi:hypothetical protein
LMQLHKLYKRIDLLDKVKCKDEDTPEYRKLQLLNEEIDKIEFKNTKYDKTSALGASTYAESIPLDGTLNSWTFIAVNWFRVDGIIILREGGGEVGEQQRLAFARSWNNTTYYEDAYYPNWIPTPTDATLHWSIMLTPAFQELPRTNEAGFSKHVLCQRMYAGSVTGYFNTPTLIDQGILISAQFPPDFNTVVPQVTGGAGYTPIPLIARFKNPQFGQWLITWRQAFAGDAAIDVIGSESILIVGLQITRIASVPIQILNTGNTLISFCSAGDSLLFVHSHQGTITVSNTTTPGPTIVLDVQPILNYTATRSTYLGAGILPPAVETAYINYALPATTTASMVLSDPKSYQGQLKNMHGGYFTRFNVHNPVFEWSYATDAMRILFNTPGISRDEMDTAIGGFVDTPSKNFMVSTQIMDGCSAALAPLWKMYRSFEVVPTAGSLYGPMALVTADKDMRGDEFVRSTMVETPHTYDESYNGSGKLKNFVNKLMVNLPATVTTASTIATSLTELIKRFAL